MVPATVNTSGRSSAEWRWKLRLRILAAATCFLRLASSLCAAAVLQDSQGFVWFNTSAFLNRYDGCEFRSCSRDPAHPNYPAGGFLKSVFKDRSGFLWIGSTESLDRFDPVTETSTRFPIGTGPGSLEKQVSDISQDRSGILWTGRFATFRQAPPIPAA